MDPIQFFDMPYGVINKVYRFLDEKSKKNISKTCHFSQNYFKYFENNYDYLKQVTKFIYKNYRLVDCSSQPLKMKDFFFYPTRLVLLGETHCKSHHRLLNSKLIKLIWDKNTKLLIEGGIESTEVAKQDQKGQLKFLKKKIAQTAESWEPYIDPSATEILDFFTKVVVNIRNLVIYISDEHNDSFDKLSSFLKENYGNHLIERFNEIIERFNEKIPEILDFKQKEMVLDISEKRKLLNVIYLKISCILVESVCKRTEEEKVLFDMINESRNNDLISNLLDVVFLSDRSGIFVAGSLHVKSELVRSEVKKIYQLVEKEKINPPPYIFLKPKGSVTEQSIIKSYNKLFKNTSHLEKKEVTEKKMEITEEKNEIVEDKKIVPEYRNGEFENLKDKLLNLDVHQMDHDENHSGYWFSISLKVLKLEIDRLLIEISKEDSLNPNSKK